ncbi:hypothetical protein NQ317_005891 [Molorchus minor]|uniref:TFIIS N-terminal domain-containing protein n=1 Tax=Molorchus minor TaxID=1323400 RepID=A0ABQ9JZZ7_9CUCU|nr:hypothetical protein NQ317_005891 [Molorchus minor]
MTKFSKKLVSKCVYVLILKNTETELVDMFMAEGGWTLIQTWLQDAVQTSNWDLVKETLGLLLVTPVDVERLKLNILPKLIKSLSRREELEGVSKLSTQLVQQWLAIVKGSSIIVSQPQVQALPEKVETAQPQLANDISNGQEVKVDPLESEPVSGENNSDAINAGTFYKPSVRDGKLVIKKLPSEEDEQEVEVLESKEMRTEMQEDEKPKIEKKAEEKEREREKRTGIDQAA